MVARIGGGCDGDGGAGRIGAAAADGAHGGIVGEDGEGVVGDVALGDGDVVEQQPIHIGGVMVAEGDVDGLSGIAAEVDGALGETDGGEGGLEQGSAGEVAGVVAGGGDVDGVVLIVIGGVDGAVVPSEGVVVSGAELYGRCHQPVVGGEGANVVDIGGGAE